MKRLRNKTSNYEASSRYEDGVPLERQKPAVASSDGLLSPPESPPPEELRPSKLRRHGSRLISALRSLTNSGVNSLQYSSAL